MQNDANSLVAMRAKDLRLVQDWPRKITHATVKLDSKVRASRGMKTYSESRIELRNLQILKEIFRPTAQINI